MDEEYNDSVDTSTDMDVSDVDVSDDIPADIPDDIPEDVPEDDYSDADISDDVTEDVSDESAVNDIEYDETDESIEEDSIEPETDELDESIDDIEEDSLEESEDTAEDHEDLDDIPEDTDGLDEEQTNEVVDDTEEIPEDTDDYEITDQEEGFDEDIPEDVADVEATDEVSDVGGSDTSEHQEDVSDAETTDETSDVEDTDTSEQSEDMTDAEATDETTDVEDTDTSEHQEDETDTEATDETSDVDDTDAAEQPEDETDAEATYETTDVEDADTAEQSEDVSEAEATDETTDVEDTDTSEHQEDVTDTEGTDETTDIEDTDTSEQPEDETDAEATYETSDVEDTDTSEQSEDMTDAEATDETSDVEDADTAEQSEDVSEAEATDETSDVDDTDAAEQPWNLSDTNDTDHSDLETYDYETAPETQDAVNPETSGEYVSADNPYRERWEEFADEFSDGKDESDGWNSLKDVPFSGEEQSDTNAGAEGSDAPSSVSDSGAVDVDDSSDASEINSISDYMNAHNYGPDDFATYSQDPQWRQLMRQEYPDYELPEMTQESANAQLSQYMNDHNYGVDDYAEYSQDPIWRELHSTAFPDDELPPLQKISEGELTESSESDVSQSADTMNAEMAEAAFNQELSREFEENILSDPELTPEQKELMLGSFDEANRSDIGTENEDVQTGNLMSDILKPSHFDDTDSVSDIQEASSFNNAMEKSNSVIDRYEKVRNNTALMNDETGYQIAMNEMSKDLEKQVTDIDLAIAENDAAVKVAEEALRNYSPEMETSPLNDSKYRELVENLQNARDQSNQLRSQKGYLESLKNEANAEVSDEFKGMTFRSPAGKPFTDTFSELINEQGVAYPDEIVNDCGVCTMGNMANQHGGKFTEKSGLSTGFGEYDYTQITDEMSPDEKAYALDHNGLTSLDSQANILNKMGYEAVKYENGASFDDIVDNISKGNSMSLNLYGRDLNSGSDIAKRPGRIAAALSGQQSVLPANHAVTIAGLAVNPSGKPIGFFVNDTGGYGGKNNSSIFVSKAKYNQMLKRTAGISSIVCTGKKVFA